MIALLGLLARLSVILGFVGVAFASISDLIMRTNYLTILDSMIDLGSTKVKIVLGLMAIIYLVIFLLSYIALSIPVVHKLEKRPETRGAMIQAMYRSNFVLMGLPIAINICGAGNVSKTAILVTIIVPTYNVLAVIILEYYVLVSLKCFARSSLTR